MVFFRPPKKNAKITVNVFISKTINSPEFFLSACPHELAECRRLSIQEKAKRAKDALSANKSSKSTDVFDEPSKKKRRRSLFSANVVKETQLSKTTMSSVETGGSSSSSSFPGSSSSSSSSSGASSSSSYDQNDEEEIAEEEHDEEELSTTLPGFNFFYKIMNL